jgi:chromosome segregation ATPase
MAPNPAQLLKLLQQAAEEIKSAHAEAAASQNKTEAAEVQTALLRAQAENAQALAQTARDEATAAQRELRAAREEMAAYRARLDAAGDERTSVPPEHAHVQHLALPVQTSGANRNQIPVADDPSGHSGEAAHTEWLKPTDETADDAHVRFDALQQAHTALQQEYQALKLHRETHGQSDTTGPTPSRCFDSGVSEVDGDTKSVFDNLRARRDELNVQLGHVEKERNGLKSKLQDIESKHATALGHKEDSLGRFREEVQTLEQSLKEAQTEIAHFQSHTADLQQRLEAAQKKLTLQENQLRALVVENAQELDRQRSQHAAALAEGLAQAAQAHAEISVRRDAAAEEARIEIERLKAEHEAQLTQLLVQQESQMDRVVQGWQSQFQESTGQLQAELDDTSRRLEHALNEFHHANRQYEALHKEMLLLMDQRDEARNATKT